MSIETRYNIRDLGDGSSALTLSEIKSHLRISDYDSDDSLLSSYIASAVEYIEKVTGVVSTVRQFVMAVDRFPYYFSPVQYAYGIIEIPRYPLVSVDTFKYYDTNGVQQSLSSSVYQVDLYSIKPRIAPLAYQVWPVTQIGRLNALEITFTAGYNVTPASMKQAIRLLVGHMYEHRENTITGTIIASIPTGLDNFIRTLSKGRYV